jgi:hypothetical protein
MRVPDRSDEPLNDVNEVRARSSAVEHCVHIAGVTGSNPVAPTTHGIPTLGPEDAAWLAGYIDGDGTIGIYRRDRKEKKATRIVLLSIDSCDMELLEHVIRLVGGSVVKKKKYAEHHRQGWTWRRVGSRQICGVLRQILPYMRCQFKKERARMIIEEWASVTPLNGAYSPQQAAAKIEFEQRFLALGKGRGKRATLIGKSEAPEALSNHPARRKT